MLGMSAGASRSSSDVLLPKASNAPSAGSPRTSMPRSIAMTIST
jgi:hypothetical protein